MLERLVVSTGNHALRGAVNWGAEKNRIVTRAASETDKSDPHKTGKTLYIIEKRKKHVAAIGDAMRILTINSRSSNSTLPLYRMFLDNDELTITPGWETEIFLVLR